MLRKFTKFKDLADKKKEVFDDIDKVKVTNRGFGAPPVLVERISIKGGEMKNKVYYKESRWLYLLILLLIIIFWFFGNIHYMAALAILIYIPSIIANELKPKRLKREK